jgi:hypothetical protein
LRSLEPQVLFQAASISVLVILKAQESDLKTISKKPSAIPWLAQDWEAVLPKKTIFSKTTF